MSNYIPIITRSDATKLVSIFYHVDYYYCGIVAQHYNFARKCMSELKQEFVTNQNKKNIRKII